MEIESREGVEQFVREVLPDHAEHIVPHLLPSIRFSAVRDPDRRPALQIGGGTALPPDIAWPTHDGRMMHLVAVVDLAQIAEIDPTGLAPRSGLLHFFYDDTAGVWGYEPGDRDGWRVVLVPDRDIDDLPRVSRPEYPDDRNPYPVLLEDEFGVPYLQWTVPDRQEEELDGVEWRRQGGRQGASVRDGFEELADEISYEALQMFGWPTVVQNPMRMQCQLMSNGLSDESPAADTPEHAAVRAGFDEWILLLQVPSWGEYDGGGRWGSDGSMYFWIRRDDLGAADFSRVWMIIRSW